MVSLRPSLQRLRRAGQYRFLRAWEGRTGPILSLEGRRRLSFASNDYLGLAGHPKVKDAATRAIRRWGVGTGSSRLVSGHGRTHQALEESLAAWMGVEGALVYPAGYMANLGVVSALVGSGDVILSDALNHASLIDACRLTKAEVIVVPHRDTVWAERRLKRMAANRKKWIVTESVFSMDGDLAPLVEWHRLAERYRAGLIVDEAHALGVFGRFGRGILDAAGVPKQGVVVTGTLSKAFGSQGGVVFSSGEIKAWLVNTSRAFIYTTALPAGLAAAALAAVPLVAHGDPLRHRLWESIHLLRAGIHRMGVGTGASQSQIIPWVVGKSSDTMRVAKRLWDRGIYAPGIRPPTVPEGTGRIRLSVSAHHTSEQIHRLLSVFRDILSK